MSKLSKQFNLMKFIGLSILVFTVPTLFCLMAARFSSIVTANHAVSRHDSASDITKRIAPIASIEWIEPLDKK